MKKVMVIGGVGLVSCFGMAQAFMYKVSTDIKSRNFYKEAMEALKQHKGALYLLGQPIVDSRAKFNSSFLKSEKNEVKVYVSGPKSKGTLFVSLVPDKEKNYSLSTIQLQIGADDSKRLVIK